MTEPVHQPFQLADSDKQSTTWARIERHLKQQEMALLRQNAAPLDELKTAFLRGRIAQIQDLLRAADEVLPPITP